MVVNEAVAVKEAALLNIHIGNKFSSPSLVNTISESMSMKG